MFRTLIYITNVAHHICAYFSVILQMGFIFHVSGYLFTLLLSSSYISFRSITGELIAKFSFLEAGGRGSELLSVYALLSKIMT